MRALDSSAPGMVAAQPTLTAEGLVPGLGSNCDGKIRGILMHYGVGDGDGGRWYDETILFRDLLRKLDPDVRFIIVTGDDDIARSLPAQLGELNDLRLPDGTPKVSYFPQRISSRKLYRCARDPYLAVTEPDGHVCFLDTGMGWRPFPITRFHEVIDGATTLAGIVPLGGGNLRASDTEIVIGIDSILGSPISTYEGRNLLHIAEQRAIPADEMKRRLEATAAVLHRILGIEKRLVVHGARLFLERYTQGSNAGGGKLQIWSSPDQPVLSSYHTNVHLALGHRDPDGTRIAFCADSTLGAAALKDLSAADRRETERALYERLYDEGFTISGVRLTKELIRERFRWVEKRALDAAIRRANQVAPAFERAIEELEDNGFRVVRVPFLPNGLSSREDDTYDAVGVSFNYTNLLIETYGDVRRVYLPELGAPALDEAAAVPFQSEGYQVTWLRGLLTPALTALGAAVGLNGLTLDLRVPVPPPKK